MILFSIVGIGVVVLVYAIRHTWKLQKAVTKKTVKTHVPAAIQALVLVAQAGELVRVAEHASLVHLAAAGMLLAIVLATKSGTEGQLH